MSPNDLNWRDLGNAARTLTQGPPHWPENVKAISMDGLTFLGLDDERNLYWDGRKLEVESKIKLSNIERALAIVVALSSITIAVIDVVKLWKGIP